MEPQFAEQMPSFQQKQEDDDGVVSMVVDIEILLFGSLIFLGVVFILGLIVNLPAAIIYCRSRQIRGFTDKFILFVLIVDLLSLLIFIPISFIYVLEYSASIGDGTSTPAVAGISMSEGKGKPFFLEDEKVFAGKSGGGGTSEGNDGDFSSYCVQQWIYLIHKLIFIMAANLSVLGALKIAVERYLAVVAPLHYHKILKSSVIFFVSLFSFILSLACAVITAVDPADFSGSFLLGGQCSFKYFDQSPSSWSPTKNQVSSISIQFDSEEEDVESSDFNGLKEKEQDVSILKSLPEAVPAAPYPYQSPQLDDTGTLSSSVAFWWWPVLKLVHASVFFLVPVTVMLFMYLRIRTEARKQNHRMAYRSKGSFIVPPAVAAAANVKKSVGCSIDAIHQVFGKFKLMQRIRRKTRMNRAARVAVLTIGLSVVCFGPLFFVQIFSAVASLTKSHLSINPWATGRLPQNGAQRSQFVKFLLPTLLACLHPLLSPLVYVYRYKRVRNELKLLLKSMISKCCFCCCNRDSHSSSSAASTDCQEIVRQFNHLAQQKLPPSLASQHQMLESQATSVPQCNVDNNATATSIRGVYYGGGEDGTTRPANADSSSGGDHYLFYASSPSSQHPPQHLLEHEPKDFVCEDDEDYNDDLVERQEYSADVEMEFSDMESQREHAISMVRPNNSGGFLNILNSWMSSYSRRWNQHRESVTSTASFITLLSNRSRSIPSSSADII